MKFGVAILGSEAPNETIGLIRMAEKLGYDFIWIPDEKFYRDVYAILMLCALNSRNVRMGTCVTDPYIRPPVLTAAAIATISEASKGRAVLGIGAGDSFQLKNIGLQRRKPVQAIREAVEVIRLISKSDSAIDYKGEIIELSNVKLDFECEYEIPIYIAGRGPRTLQLAGEVGDGVIIGSLTSLEGLRYALKWIGRGVEKSKRGLGEIDVVSWAYCTIGYTDEAKELVKPIIAYSVNNSRSILGDIGISWELAKPIIEAFDKHQGATAGKYVSEELLDMFSVTGTPQECRCKVEELASAEIDQIAMVPYPSQGEGRKTTIELFAKKVINGFK